MNSNLQFDFNKNIDDNAMSGISESPLHAQKEFYKMPLNNNNNVMPNFHHVDLSSVFAPKYVRK